MAHAQAADLTSSLHFLCCHPEERSDEGPALFSLGLPRPRCLFDRRFMPLMLVPAKWAESPEPSLAALSASLDRQLFQRTTAISAKICCNIERCSRVVPAPHPENSHLTLPSRPARSFRRRGIIPSRSVWLRAVQCLEQLVEVFLVLLVVFPVAKVADHFRNHVRLARMIPFIE